MTQYQLFDALTPDEYAALKASIRANGVLVPIEMDEQHHILDGHHRLQAWRELRAEGFDIPDYPTVTREGMTEAAKRAHIMTLNMDRRHLSKEARAAWFADMRADGMTLQAIADTVGMTKQGVHKALGQLSTELTTERVTGRDGKSYPAVRPHTASSVGYADDIDEALEYQPSFDEYPSREIDEDTGEILSADNGVDEPEDAPLETSAPPSSNGMDIHYRSESKERYTPADFMAYVREMFVDIDLDPASNAAANGVIRASRYYSREDDGLAQSWEAENVFLNPPYGDEIKPFIEKAVEEYQRGAFREAILLVPARTDTEWFGLLRVYPRCFVTGRMKFWNDEDPTLNSSAPFPSVVFYLGGRLRKFGQIFSEIGDVYVLWETE